MPSAAALEKRYIAASVTAGSGVVDSDADVRSSLSRPEERADGESIAVDGTGS